jgi:serine kinase of HPr protein (carbohydrate metabolism regulator)
MNTQIHATCVSVHKFGVLIQGPSGIGKSDLALRLINEGSMLIADDRVNLLNRKESLIASAPKQLAGLIEVRGIGILQIKFQTKCSISLVVNLTKTRPSSRLPLSKFTKINGIKIPVIKLFPFDPSTTSKLQVALKVINGDISRIDD